MNILILNAFGSSPKASQRFDSFCRIIKNIFKKISKGSGIENFNFICRSPNNISEFIYKHDMISGDVNQNKRNKKNFDKIDIVIIDGYEKYAPWDQRSYTLCEFIKLCKITNKTLYAGGVGFEILIYYLATGSLNEYNFVNAKGQIKSLEEMSMAPKKFLKELKNNEIFLDYVTGDILEYKSDETWVPIKNIGMHKQLTAEKYMPRGKFVLKECFRGKDFVKNLNAFSTAYDEIKVKITKQYFHHYLFENLPLEFIASTSMTWFPHFFNVLNQTYQFKILCESEKGPVVIEHKNSTGVLFHIIDKYQDSVHFMENFIKNKFTVIQNKIFKFKHMDGDYLQKSEKNEIPAIFKYYISSLSYKKTNQNIENTKSTNMDKVTNSLPFSRIKNIKSEANHVGFSINNRDMIFVENNYINQSPIVSTKRNRNILYYKPKEEIKINSNSHRKNSRPNLRNLSYNDYIEKDKDKNNARIKTGSLFLSCRNKNKLKIKYRLKSSKINTSTNYKNNIRRFNPILSERCKLPKFPIELKKNVEEKDDELDDIYIPKYPRPAILSGRTKDIKTNSFNNMNLDSLSSNNKRNNNVNFFEMGLLNRQKFLNVNQ